MPSNKTVLLELLTRGNLAATQQLRGLRCGKQPKDVTIEDYLAAADNANYAFLDMFITRKDIWQRFDRNGQILIQMSQHIAHDPNHDKKAKYQAYAEQLIRDGMEVSRMSIHYFIAANNLELVRLVYEVHGRSVFCPAHLVEVAALHEPDVDLMRLVVKAARTNDFDTIRLNESKATNLGAIAFIVDELELFSSTFLLNAVAARKLETVKFLYEETLERRFYQQWFDVTWYRRQAIPRRQEFNKREFYEYIVENGIVRDEDVLRYMMEEDGVQPEDFVPRKRRSSQV